MNNKNLAIQQLTDELNKFQKKKDELSRSGLVVVKTLTTPKNKPSREVFYISGNISKYYHILNDINVKFWRNINTLTLSHFYFYEDPTEVLLEKIRESKRIPLKTITENIYEIEKLFGLKKSA